MLRSIFGESENPTEQASTFALSTFRDDSLLDSESIDWIVVVIKLIKWVLTPSVMQGIWPKSIWYVKLAD